MVLIPSVRRLYSIPRPWGDELPPAPPGTSYDYPDAALLPRDSERVEGEVEPDFSSLGDVTGDGEGEGDEPPEKNVEKPPEKKQEKPPEKKPDAKAKPEEKKKQETEKDKPLPEDDKKPEDKKPAPEKKKEEAKSKPEEKPAPEKKDEPKTVPKDDTDIDKIEARPGSSPKVVDDIGRLKEAVKTARAVAREAQAKATTLETQAKSIQPLDDQTKQRLDFLEGYYRIQEGENNPQFVAEHQAKVKAADDGVFALLRANGLTEEAETKMRGVGLDKYSNEWWQKNILEKIKDPFAAQELINAISGRRAVIAEKAKAAEAFAKDREAYSKSREEAQKKWWQDWGTKVEQRVIESSKGEEWASNKEYPEGASDTEKAAIDAHNELVNKRGTEFAELVKKVSQLDPTTVSDVIKSAIHEKILIEESKTLADDLKRANDRVEELEAELAAINGASRRRRETKPEERQKHGNREIEPGMTADQAFDAAGI